MKISSLLKKRHISKKHITILKFLFNVYYLLSGFQVGNFIRSRHVMRKVKIKSGEKVFDAGCGVGLYSLRIAYKGAYVVGGDLSPLFKYSLLFGDAKLTKRVDFIIMDLNYTPIKSESFDKILCVDVLEHIPNDKKVIAEFSRILKKNGEILIHVPNLKRYAKLKNSAKAKQMSLEKLYGHFRHGYTLDQLSTLLKENNIDICDYTYTFGFWARVAGWISTKFKDSIIIFPFLFFLSQIDKPSKFNEYNGGILIRGKRN